MRSPTRHLRGYATAMVLAVVLAVLFARVRAQPSATPSMAPTTSSIEEVPEPTAPVAAITTTDATPATEPEPAPPAPAPALDQASAPAPASAPTPALTNDMREILRKVGSIPCVEPTRSRMFSLLYDANVALHDACIAESGYRFFPYTGELPTSAQIVATVTSTACMQLYAGAVLAEFPECDIDFVSLRSAAEVFYRVKKDVDAERTPPTQAQFYEFYNLNRVVNLLNENASLIEDVFRGNPTSAAVSLSEMTRLMNPIVLVPGVTLNDDMSITIATSPPVGANNNKAAVATTVADGSSESSTSASHSGSASESNAPGAPTSAPTLDNSTTRSSGAWAAARTAGGVWKHVLGGVMAVVAAALV